MLPEDPPLPQPPRELPQLPSALATSLLAKVNKQVMAKISNQFFIREESLILAPQVDVWTGCPKQDLGTG
jgi:hypothetical protein